MSETKSKRFLKQEYYVSYKFYGKGDKSTTINNIVNGIIIDTKKEKQKGEVSGEGRMVMETKDFTPNEIDNINDLTNNDFFLLEEEIKRRLAKVNDWVDEVDLIIILFLHKLKAD